LVVWVGEGVEREGEGMARQTVASHMEKQSW
jgi:hypothetical protein